MTRRLRPRRRSGPEEAGPVTEVNVIPVIDISLVLLVVLFISAPLLSYPSLPLELPRALRSEKAGDFVSVTYTAGGEMAVLSRASAWGSLEQDLREALGKQPAAAVVLRVDKAVPYRAVERLIRAAQAAGGRRIALGTETPR